MKIKVGESFEKTEFYYPNFRAVVGFTNMLADLFKKFKRRILPSKNKKELVFQHYEIFA